MMLFDGTRENEYVVDVWETEIEALCNFVDKPLERLASIPKAEAHKRKFEEAERSRYGGLRNVIGVDGYLMIRLDEVDDRENCGSSET
jgi:hypothetical protein